jgi:transposase-like protein
MTTTQRDVCEDDVRCPYCGAEPVEPPSGLDVASGGWTLDYTCEGCDQPYSVSEEMTLRYTVATIGKRMPGCSREVSP